MRKALLVCYVSSKVGIGHLSRLLALANKLKKDRKIIPEFLIFGDLIKKDDLNQFKLHNFSFKCNFIKNVESILKIKKFDILVLDIYPGHKIIDLFQFFKKIKKNKIHIVGIDSLIQYCNILDLIWIPSFNFDCAKYINCKSVIKSGWDTYLIQKNLKNKKWQPGKKVLILTGGSDAYNLSKTLPTDLDRMLNKNTELNWVKGPLSNSPNIPKNPKLKWIIHEAPNRLDELITKSNYVLTIFGISFFEVLQYGIPSVVFSPSKKKDKDELKALSKEMVAEIANTPKLAVKKLYNLINNDKISNKFSSNALSKMKKNGAENLSKKIYSLVQSNE